MWLSSSRLDYNLKPGVWVETHCLGCHFLLQPRATEASENRNWVFPLGFVWVDKHLSQTDTWFGIRCDQEFLRLERNPHGTAEEQTVWHPLPYSSCFCCCVQTGIRLLDTWCNSSRLWLEMPTEDTQDASCMSEPASCEVVLPANFYLNMHSVLCFGKHHTVLRVYSITSNKPADKYSLFVLCSSLWL